MSRRAFWNAAFFTYAEFYLIVFSFILRISARLILLAVVCCFYYTKLPDSSLGNNANQNMNSHLARFYSISG